jgi:hypothetical protein
MRGLHFNGILFEDFGLREPECITCDTAAELLLATDGLRFVRHLSAAGDGAAVLLRSIPALRSLSCDAHQDPAAVSDALGAGGHPSLVRVHLPGCSSGYRGLVIGDEEGADALVAAVPRLPALRYLDVSYNDLGDAGGRALAAALARRDVPLAVLTIAGNGFSADVRAAFGRCAHTVQ